MNPDYAQHSRMRAKGEREDPERKPGEAVRSLGIKAPEVFENSQKQYSVLSTQKPPADDIYPVNTADYTGQLSKCPNTTATFPSKYEAIMPISRGSDHLQQVGVGANFSGFSPRRFSAGKRPNRPESDNNVLMFLCKVIGKAGSSS